MWLYGLVVAEGDKRKISLHREETDISSRAANIYYKKIRKNSCVRYNGKNGMVLDFNSPAYYNTVFFKHMQVGYGARNKSISYLFNISNIDLIRNALFGLFEGDGCFRKQLNKKNNKNYFSLSFKTTSKKLAYELTFLLKKCFDITASCYYGISPQREIEGRKLDPSDYYKIDIYGKENLKELFPDYYENNLTFNNVGKNGKYSHTTPSKK